MHDFDLNAERRQLARLISLVEEALALCDALGLTLAGIDLCAALEKLAVLRPSGEETSGRS